MEHEVWGLFPNETIYNEYEQSLTQRFGTPARKRRLSISFWDPNLDKNLDTRIRITNGVAEIMQKVGRWENEKKLEMQEIDVPLSNDPDKILNLFKILKNSMKLTVSPKVIQYESALFNTGDYEIKLSKQHGKGVVKEIFEVECLRDGKDLLAFVSELGLTSFLLDSNVDFWEQWDKEVNIFTDSILEDELRGLIASYL